MFKVDKVQKDTYVRRSSKQQEVYEDDFKYYVSYDTDNESSCEESGCDDEGICRCSRIVDCKVDNSFRGVNYFFDQAYEDTGDALNRALDHWFLRKHFPAIDWGFESSGGYYGEELHRIYPENDNNFFNKAATFELLSPKEKIEFMLEHEYGKVLPSIKKVDDWQLKAILTDDLLPSQNTHLSTQILDEYKEFCEGLVKSSHQHFQDNTKILAPLTLRSGKGYQIIDGRHRATALTSEYAYMETKVISRQVNKKQKNGTVKVITRNDHKDIVHPFVAVYMWVICPREK